MTTTCNRMNFMDQKHKRFFTKNELENQFRDQGNPQDLLPSSSPKNEYLLQKLWFESWFRPELKTTTGLKVTLIQSGFWNHGAGPDFSQAAYRDRLNKVHVGPVEVHLDARDWYRHRHHLDPSYNEVILHLVWKPNSQATRTLSGKIIPQIDLSKFIPLTAEDLTSIDFDQARETRALAKPGICQQSLASRSEKDRSRLIEEAGWVRMQHKAHRLRLRQRAVGRTQALWELLGEACGYSQNQIAFRVLTQRVRAQDLIGLPTRDRKAILMGVAGFLPNETLLTKQSSPSLRQEAESIWESWWRPQGHWSLSVLPSRAWTLHGVRPLNRPERRLIALAHLIPRLPSLLKSLEQGRRPEFRNHFTELKDFFWERHSTWNSQEHPPFPLLGVERLSDLEINLFALWQIMLHDEVAREDLAKLKMTPNKKTRLAWARIGSGTPFKGPETNLFFQQGLIHLLQEFCYHDQSNCQQCPYPAQINSHSIHDQPTAPWLGFDDYESFLHQMRIQPTKIKMAA